MSARRPIPEEAASESTTYTLLSGNRSARISEAFFALLYAPEMPEDRQRCTTSFPCSRKGVKTATYSEMFGWEVRVIAPPAIFL